MQEFQTNHRTPHTEEELSKLKNMNGKTPSSFKWIENNFFAPDYNSTCTIGPYKLSVYGYYSYTLKDIEYPFYWNIRKNNRKMRYGSSPTLDRAIEEVETEFSSLLYLLSRNNYIEG